jgi:hypothetical protein
MPQGAGIGAIAAGGIATGLTGANCGNPQKPWRGMPAMAGGTGAGCICGRPHGAGMVPKPGGTPFIPGMGRAASEGEP